MDFLGFFRAISSVFQLFQGIPLRAYEAEAHVFGLDALLEGVGHWAELPQGPQRPIASEASVA